MAEAPISHMPDDTGPSQIAWRPSEVLTNYERLLRLYADEARKDELNPHQPIPQLLLKSFSPSYVRRLLKSAGRILKVPNTLPQDLVGGTIVLQELEKLDDQTLHGIAECNRINHRRLLQRSAFGIFPKIFSVVVLVLGLVKTIKDIFDVDKFAVFFSVVWDILVSIAVGLAIGGVGNLILVLPMLGLVRAIDDLIAITVAFRGKPNPER
jgi:hypothetical protein